MELTAACEISQRAEEPPSAHVRMARLKDRLTFGFSNESEIASGALGWWEGLGDWEHEFWKELLGSKRLYGKPRCRDDGELVRAAYRRRDDLLS